MRPVIDEIVNPVKVPVPVTHRPSPLFKMIGGFYADLLLEGVNHRQDIFRQEIIVHAICHLVYKAGSESCIGNQSIEEQIGPICL